jgi:SSS family solute:Na+ symporter
MSIKQIKRRDLLKFGTFRFGIPLISSFSVAGIIRNEPGFSLMDNVLYTFITGWIILWAIIFVVGTIAAKVLDLGEVAWSKFWHGYIWMGLILGAITTAWLTIGGLIDIKKLFARLSMLTRDDSDDGEVYMKADAEDEG